MATAKILKLWAAGLTGVAIAAIGLFAMPSTALAGGAGTGTINGGPYTVKMEGEDVSINSDNTTVITYPAIDKDNIEVRDDGTIRITNVPTGTYRVDVQFQFTSDMCERNWFRNVVSTLTPPLQLFCRTTDVDDQHYGITRIFSVTVRAGQTSNLQPPSNGSLGDVQQVTAGGQPIVDCTGKGVLMAWVVCPVIENVLGVMDWTMNYFIQPFLAINPLTTTNSDGSPNQVYEIWNNIRNFANLLFIASFFIIVFSQATSIGISNYGIKRLLPRLVLIAVGTNISFFICAFMVDVFNVLGIGAASLMISTVVDGTPNITIGTHYFNLMFAGGPHLALASLLSQGIITAAVLFGAAMFLIIGAAILFVAAVVILLRQIAIIFLIIVSPLAFVAGLLPNTQKYFSGWFSLFGRLLIMYPIFMILFASGKIASTVIQQIG